VTGVREAVETYDDSLASVESDDDSANGLELHGCNVISAQLYPAPALPEPESGWRNPVTPEVAERSPTYRQHLDRSGHMTRRSTTELGESIASPLQPTQLTTVGMTTLISSSPVTLWI
jgi:hypothetical protein